MKVNFEFIYNTDKMRLVVKIKILYLVIYSFHHIFPSVNELDSLSSETLSNFSHYLFTTDDIFTAQQNLHQNKQGKLFLIYHHPLLK